MKVPGAKAPEIDVHRLLNSWPRLLLKCNGELATFVQSMLSGDPLLCDEGTPPSLLWPVPLPYPEVFRSGGGDGSFWRKRRLSVQLMVLDWLYLGKPKTAPRTLKLGQRLTSGQWRIVKLLEGLAEDDNSVQHVDATGMGRTAAKAETQDEEVAALHRALLQVQSFDGGYGRSSVTSRSSEHVRTADDEVTLFGLGGWRYRRTALCCSSPFGV